MPLLDSSVECIDRGDASTVDIPDDLRSLIVCPSCSRSALSASAESLVCGICKSEFPVYASGRAQVPWLFSDPAATLLEWKARFNGFLHANWEDQSRLRRALKEKTIGNLSKERLSLMLEAKMTHRLQVTELLAPLEFECIDFDRGHDPASLLRSRVPQNQGLSSYYDNIFRDWCWGDEENAHQLAAIESVSGAYLSEKISAALTIGAGGCRLAYDFHRKFAPTTSIALDINPLLMFAASRIVSGERVSLFEFPVAPVAEADFAVNQSCAAPSALTAEDGFHFLFADGLNPPLLDNGFDVVLTPWVIDIIPQNLRDFALAVNRLVKPGGMWINTGSLAFFHRDPTWCYSEEEALELVERCGFEVLNAERRPLPYLQSPHSAHWRTEHVLSFSARKLEDVDDTRHYRYLPEWLIDTSVPVPSLEEFAIASSDHLLRAQILAAVDGKRSMEAIASALAREYGLRSTDALTAVRRILQSLYEAQLTRLPDSLTKQGS
jgi:hypothetical protein